MDQDNGSGFEKSEGIASCEKIGRNTGKIKISLIDL
jgi:hypothetical protein